MSGPAAAVDTLQADLSSARSQRMRRKLRIVTQCILIFLFSVAIAKWGIRPGWQQLGSDFPNYYTAATLFRQGVPLDRAYEWTWFQREAIRIGVTDQPLVGFVPQPPATLVPVLPLTSMQPLTAKRAWIASTFVLLISAAFLIADVTGLSLAASIVILLACVGPLAANFRLGQYYVLLLVVLLLAYREFKRGRRFSSGVLLAAAGMLKLFPFGFAALFIFRRQWRALAGMLAAGVIFAVASVAIFGAEIHRVLLEQVLPRAMRGELLAPYAVGSFAGLWRHLFVFEPQLNPFPLYRSPLCCAVLMAATTVVFGVTVIALLRKRDLSDALAWSIIATTISATASLAVSYHYCVLIFPAALAIGEFAKSSRWGMVGAVATAYSVTALPSADNTFLWLGTVAMFAILVYGAGVRLPTVGEFATWGGVAAIALVGLALINLRALEHREPECRRRVANAQSGIRASDPVRASGVELAFDQMYLGGYRAVVSTGTGARFLESQGRLLALAASESTPWLYFEVAGTTSKIYRIDATQPNSELEFVTEGLDPSLSPNGQWLAFARRHGTVLQLYRLRISSRSQAEPVSLDGDILEAAITDRGAVVASIGPASRAHLVSTDPSISLPTSVAGRHPAISHSGESLAFSRRFGEYWQLMARDVATGRERQLTDSPCNALQPFWAGDAALLYATDCGRGLGLSAIARVPLDRP